MKNENKTKIVWDKDFFIYNKRYHWFIIPTFVFFYSTNHFPNALEIINKWYNEGNVITFFTARESKDREVTETWLKEKGFKYHGLVMDKPRIKDGQEYVWIDNRKVRAITYLGTWSELKEVDAKIQTFE